MAGTLIRRGNQHLMERVAGRITLLSGWQRALAAFASGAVAVTALPPYDFMAAGFVSFTVLVWLLDGATPEGRPSLTRRLAPAFITGWLFGFGYFLAGLWWIGNALLVEAEEFAWALPLAVLALPAALAIFYGLATVLARIFWGNDFGRILALAAGFGAAEWLRSVLFTGFPWNAIGYAAMPVPILMQPVAVIGLFGMNAIAVLIFSMPALLGTGRYVKTGLAVMLIIAASVLGFGYWRLAQPMEGKSVDVRIVQASVSQSGKWDGQLRDNIFRTHLQLSGDQSEGRKPQLVVWPETAVPFLFAERPDALVALSELLDENQILLTGAVRSEGGTISGETPRFYNSIVAINDKGEIFDAADKVHLVPFGEYLPFSDFLRNLGIRELVTAPGIFSPSNARSLLEMPDGLKLLPMICYEIIFPGELEPLANNADAIINVTNDAWYGDTPGPYQHFRQAQVRAVEAGLPLIRAANNGLSAIVDSRGRIVDGLALDAVGAIDGPLLLARSPVFPWRNYSLVAILLLFATIACIMQISTRSRSN